MKTSFPRLGQPFFLEIFLPLGLFRLQFLLIPLGQRLHISQREPTAAKSKILIPVEQFHGVGIGTEKFCRGQAVLLTHQILDSDPQSNRQFPQVVWF